MLEEKPLYIELAERIIDLIKNDLSPGDTIPSERDFIAKTNMSRTTIRLALKEVELLGFIKTVPGKGRYVTKRFDSAINIGSMYSFTEEMKLLGKIPRTVILKISLKSSTREISDKLEINESDKIIYIKRLRLADDIPMMIEDTYLPYELFKGLEKMDLNKVSMYELMRDKYHIIVKYAEEEIYANVLKGNDSKQLEIKNGEPVLEIFRTTFSIKNQVIEFTHSIARADKFSYRTSHINNKYNNNKYFSDD